MKGAKISNKKAKSPVTYTFLSYCDSELSVHENL